MSPVPPLTPYLVVSDARAAVEFYKQAFGGTQDGEAHTMPGSDKIMHARMLINDALIMISDDFSEMMQSKKETPEALGGSPITLALQVADAQSFWDKAVAGGALVTMPLKDQFWGDRYGQLADPFGHKWSVSQVIRVMTDAEMQDSAQKAMSKRGTLQA